VRASLVAIRPTGSRPPVFCVHPIGGSVACYAELARALGDDQPFYGLQATGAETSIESMAARYVEEILSIQRNGPYTLAGASMGGMVAYEMAQRLCRHSEEIALLALFDASPHWKRMGFPDEHEDGQLMSRFAVELASVLGRTGSVAGTSNFEDLIETFRSDMNPSQLRSLFETFAANMRALRAYSPLAYPGRIVLLRASDGTEDVDDPSLGWRDLAERGVDVHVVQGDHFSMLRKPHVEFLAEQLKAYLSAMVPGPEGRQNVDHGVSRG